MTAAAAVERLRAALAQSYSIDRELGRGGMATVYLAQDFKHGGNCLGSRRSRDGCERKRYHAQGLRHATHLDSCTFGSMNLSIGLVVLRLVE